MPSTTTAVGRLKMSDAPSMRPWLPLGGEPQRLEPAESGVTNSSVSLSVLFAEFGSKTGLVTEAEIVSGPEELAETLTVTV